jgi:hypothetical protein
MRACFYILAAIFFALTIWWNGWFFIPAIGAVACGIFVVVKSKSETEADDVTWNIPDPAARQVYTPPPTEPPPPNQKV